MLGPLAKLGAEYNERIKAGEQMPTQFVWILQQLAKDTRQPGDPLSDPREHRMVAINSIGKVIIFVQDPVVLGDLIGKHNAFFDKHEMTGQIFEPLFKDVFGTMKTNEVWQSQRRTISHMFFRQRLSVMVGVFKQHLQASIDKWLTEIKANGEARIDITVEFERIFAHSINHICFGEDFNDDRFDYHLYDKSTDTFTLQKVSMRQAVSNLTIVMVNGYVR